MNGLLKFKSQIATRGKYFAFAVTYIFATVVVLVPAGTVSAAHTPTEYNLPVGNQAPTDIVTAGGLMWYMNQKPFGVYNLSSVTTSGVITDYNLIPPGYVSSEFSGRSLKVDSLGNLWVAGCAATAEGIGSKRLMLGKVDSSTAAITYYHFDSLTCRGYNSFDWSVSGSAIDGEDNIWVSMHRNGYSGYTKLLKFSSSGTLLYSYDPNGIARNWTDFVVGPDGNIWVADSRNNQITKLTLSVTTGVVVGNPVHYAVPSEPKGITVGPDSNLWFGEDGGAIGRITTDGVLTHYSVPSGGRPQRLAIGPDGAVWFTTYRSSNTASDAVGRITTGGIVTEYSIPTWQSRTFDITAGPDSAMWFTERDGGKIGRLSAEPFFSEYSLPAGNTTPTTITTAGGSMWYINQKAFGVYNLSNITTSGAITNYSLIPPGYVSSEFSGRSLSVDSSGNVWVAGCAATAGGIASKRLVLGRVDTSTAAITYFHFNSLTCRGYNSFDWSVFGSAIDSDDNIWVSMHRDGASGYTQLVKLSPSGVLLSTYNPNTINRNWIDFTVGSDGNLWIADSRKNLITKLVLSPATGTVTGSPVHYTVSSAPKGIITGPDGNLWFGQDNGAIGKITTGGVVTVYLTSSGRRPQSLVKGPDGAIWFTAYRSSGTVTDAIGRVTMDGAITEYPIPTTSAYPASITVGPDAAVWFTEQTGNKIGRLGY